jgi:hypothetical protein
MRTLDDGTILLNAAEREVMRMEPDVLREAILERAVASGKIQSRDRDRYRERYSRDQPGTVALIASLAPGVSPAQAEQLSEMAQLVGEDLLAFARAAFPELRRRHVGWSSLSQVRSVSLARVAGEGRIATTRPPAPMARRAGWYSRRNGAPVVKDAGSSLAPWWQNYSPPERPTGPTPFPAGLNVGD